MNQKRMNNKAEITMTGFVVSLLAIALIITTTTIFITGMESEYVVSGESNTSLGKYNQSEALISNLDNLRVNATNIKQDQGLLDIVGGFFSSGYSALKLTFASFDVFEGMMESAESDIPYLAEFSIMTYVKIIIIAIILIGIVITILVKMNL